LLRVLEERSITPLGSMHTVPVDMKIICATHRNLTEFVSNAAFRKDLYYRIKGIEVRLPRLSERTDLAEIAQKFAEEELGAQKSGFSLSPEVLAIFQRYSWPGNVRELKSVIRFITSMHGAARITLEHLPECLIEINLSKPQQVARATVLPHTFVLREDTPPMTDAQTLFEATEAGEKRYIVEALRSCKWNITDASMRLGVSRATLHRRIRKYQIVSPNHLG
jgi:transcriptional regulator of acetoin/glycerol metabolism